MRLSQFNLSWFEQHGSKHSYFDEWSRPGLTNFIGSLQADADPTAIKHLIIPPVSSAEETTCLLTINGKFLPSQGLKTEVRWCPWAIRRQCEIENWKVETVLAMPPQHPGALQRIALTNTSNADQELNLELRVSGRAVNEGIENWNWQVPSVALTVDNLHGHAGLDPHIEIQEDGCLFQSSDGQDACSAQFLSPTPDHWRDQVNAGYHRHLAPGEKIEIYFVVGLGENAAVTELCRDILTAPEKAFQASETLWRNLWQSVFSGDRQIVSGQLPDLDLPEAVLPLAAASILTALQLRRTHLPNKGKVRYSIATPRRVEAGFYIWDWSMASRLLSAMDPEATYEQWTIALSIDHSQCQQINNLTEKGCGWAYSFDTYNLFIAGWHLWQKSGRAEEFLNREVCFENATHTVREVFNKLARRWDDRLMSKFGLADYGGKESLLECVSTYQHGVAALNAAAIWMYERLAEIVQASGQNDLAERALEKADAIFVSLIEQLYEPSVGCFYAIYPNGRKVLIRHGLDVQTVLRCIGHRLNGEQRTKIQHFIETELMTPAWMRALSPYDSDAAVSGIRADHQFCGAYGAWPAQMGLGLLNIGQGDTVKKWLDRMAIIARQGPIGQAYFDEICLPNPENMPLKVTDEFPHCTHWCIMGGGQFWELIEQLYKK